MCLRWGCFVRVPLARGSIGSRIHFLLDGIFPFSYFARYWTVEWTAADGRASPPSDPPARFVTAASASSDDDWGGAQWVGAGHGQLRARFTLDDAANDESVAAAAAAAAAASGDRDELRSRSLSLLYDAFVVLASPGGAVVRVDGQAAADRVGVAAWCVSVLLLLLLFHPPMSRSFRENGTRAVLCEW